MTVSSTDDATNLVSVYLTGIGRAGAGQYAEIFNNYQDNVASDEYSHAEGDRTTASGRASHAEGDWTFASGAHSHAEGLETQAKGSGSHAEGEGTTAKDHNSHAEGEYTHADAIGAHAEGLYTTASGEYSHAEGEYTHASGYDSHAEGIHTEASGTAAHAEGGYTLSQGDYSHAEGYYSMAIGDFSHAEGGAANGVAKRLVLGNKVCLVVSSQSLGFPFDGTKISIDGKIYELKINDILSLGSYNLPAGLEDFTTEDYPCLIFGGAIGNCSHTEGSACTAQGPYSHAEGIHTKASALASHAEGRSVVANQSFGHVQGKYNAYPADSQLYAHIVGGGTAGAELNIHTVDWNGKGYFKGGTTTTGADYAEYFEWLDGNPSNEDRAGTLVALNGDKIYPANHEDEILGVISGTAAVVGDNPECDWQGRFLTDNYGRPIVEMIEEFVTTLDPEAGESKQTSVGFFPHYTLNPEYDETKKYIRRSERPEWDVVGLMGKLHVNDDGTCVPNGYAKCGGNGVATASAEKTNMRVMKRITDNIILVFMK